MAIRSEEFKRVAVQKFHSRGSRSVQEIAQGMGVSAWTLYDWAKRYDTSPGMKKNSERRPQDWSAAEKWKAVVEFEGLAEEKRGEYLRREGLHSEHVESWKKSMQSGLDSGGEAKASRGQVAELKAEVKELKRDLHRKDRALAETTALLVLKKKADLIWGTGENE
jgi:transposase